jgi:hypothetical protein
MARSKEFGLNYFWRELAVQFQVRLAVLSAFIAMGVVKVGYTADFESNPGGGEFATDDAGNLVIDARSGLPKLARGDFVRNEDGIPVIDPDTGLPILKPGERLTNEHFFVKWVPWDAMLFDPEGMNDFSQHAWVAEEWLRPTEDVKRDTNFKHRTHIRATESLQQGQDGDAPAMGIETSMDSEVQTDEARTRGYTIYDFKKRRILVLVDAARDNSGNHDFFVRNDPLPPEQEHGPYVFLRFNEVPKRWEPMPDVTPLKSPQEQINILNSKVITHISRADRKYGYTPDAFESQEEKEKLQGGGDMSFTELPQGPNSVWPIPVAQMDQAVYAAIPNLDRSFDELAGQPAEARGVAKAETATQASILENRNVMRESDRRDNLIHDFIADVGRKLLQTMKANMTMPIWVSIADATTPYPFDEGGRFVTQDDLQDEADVEIQVGSMLPKTNAVMRQQFSTVMATLAQAPFLAASPKLLERLFELFEVENVGLSEEIAAMARQQLQNDARTPPSSGAVGDLPSETTGVSSPVGGTPVPTVAGGGGVQ